GGAHNNVISNNLNDGIFVNGDVADNCKIDHCFIGTDENGNLAPNGVNGIHIVDADVTKIGTTHLNTISGNIANGIIIEGSADGTTIQNNNIGSVTGNAAYGNGVGINIMNVPVNTFIGSSSIVSGNTIVGNSNEGILISSSNSTTISGNYIGIDNTNIQAPNA